MGAQKSGVTKIDRWRPPLCRYVPGNEFCLPLMQLAPACLSNARVLPNDCCCNAYHLERWGLQTDIIVV